MDYFTGSKRPAKRPIRRGRKSKRSMREPPLMSRVGEPVGKHNAKANSNTVDQAISSRTLYSNPLFNLPTGPDVNQRLRDVVNFRGVKICMSFLQNNDANTSLGQRTYINVAVITPKDQDLNGDNAVPVTNFFRQYGVDARATDFSTDLAAIEFKCLPINTDLYNVHRHMRFELGPAKSTEGTNAKTISFYQKVNRQIRYTGSNSNPQGKNMYLVYWYDIQDKAATTPAVLTVAQQIEICRYFKEPAACC